MWTRRLALVLMLAVSPAFGASRFVYLNSTGGGSQLNDCPNPAHNSKGTGNTDELFYCINDYNIGHDGRIICDAATGCQAWTVTTLTCQFCAPANPECTPGTAGNPVVNGTLLKLSTGQTYTKVYGQPQACVYDSPNSTSCEVHAGTYRKAGGWASEEAHIGDGTIDGTCGRSNCWKAFVIEFGSEPSKGGACCGTQAAPFYLRGAVFNGSTDTWDSNGNKIPDGTAGTVDAALVSYPVRFNGDLDNDAAFDNSIASPGICSVGGAACTNIGGTCNTTGTCNSQTESVITAAWNATSGSTFTGDAFYAVIKGCGDPGYNDLCRTSQAGYGNGNTDWIKVDTDADGLAETNYGVLSAPFTNTNYPPVNWFYQVDIEVTRMNGGNASAGNGIRQMHGIFTEHGNKSSTGYVDDHLYIHDNDYSACARIADNGCENFWAMFADQENSGCDRPWEIKNSLLIQNNENGFNDDCGSGSECGCGMNIHDNRYVVDIASSFSRTTHVGYWKGIDTIHGEVGRTPIKKAFRFWNNEVILKQVGASFQFHDLQSLGNMRGLGLGEFWIYGNLFRTDPDWTGGSTSGRMELSFIDSSHPGTDGLYKYYLFNNTYDYPKEMEAVTNNSVTGTRLVERNNAYFRTVTVHATTNVTTIVRTTANEICSASNPSCTTASATRTVWFTPGAFATGSPSYWNGLANYVPNATGATQAAHPIYENGSCDPDGDGAPGYKDFDGVTDITVWKDIAGNWIDCSGGPANPSSLISIGAIQPNSEVVGPSVCGNGGPLEPGETCDDGSQAVNACNYGDDPPLQQVCNATCDGLTNCSSPQYCGDGAVQPLFEQCDGSLLNGHTCTEFGCTGTPTCVSCQITSTGCVCPNTNVTLIGVDLFGVSWNP